MIVILTHENADFDAVASQWAAHRLNPEALPLLPRRINRNVGQFLALYWGAFRFRRPEEWRRQRVDAIILVDTQGLPSVRGVRPNTPVHVIDHHTPQAERPGWSYAVQVVGATTTLMVEMMQAAGLQIAPEEATLLLLGIYEDTGTLCYDTTTARDARAAAWLLERGADLPTARRFMDVPLTPEQQQLYDLLVNATEWHTLEGQTVVLAAVQGPDDYEDEISSVATRLRDALQPAALLVLVGLPRRVHLVARSSADAVDVGEIARALGGGGHSRAAAATIHGMSLAAARRRALELLPEVVQPMTRVAAVMSHHVKTIPAGESVGEAAAEMQRHGHEGYPVVDEQDRLVGLLTRRAVDRAIGHKLEHLKVHQIMKSGRITVRPSDSVQLVQELMVDEGWGQVPVTAENDPDRLIGIVTRTDMLRLLLHKPRPVADRPEPLRLLEHALGPPFWDLVRRIGQTAAEEHMPVYLVGGPVRDALLRKPVFDLDIVVEGDAIALARAVVERLGGKIHTHGRFGTAKWMLDETVQVPLPPGRNGDAPRHIDFVSARTEFYTEPTVLPTVARGSIKLDLVRRDFTINTLAVRLDGVHLGELLDFYGGLRDLHEGQIRVLHSLSFIDDPTRILRAVRFEQRLAFQIEPRTLELLKASVELLERVTGARIRHEIELSLQEPNPAAILARLDDLGVLAALHPELRWTEQSAVAYRHLPALAADPIWQSAAAGDNLTAAYFFAWIGSQPMAVQQAVVERLRTRAATRESLELLDRLLGALAALGPQPRPSEVEQAARPAAANPAVLLAARALRADTPPAAWLDAYQGEQRHVRTAVTGNDLRALRIPPGPHYSVILDALLAARLDGAVHTADEERALLAELLAQGLPTAERRRPDAAG